MFQENISRVVVFDAYGTLVYLSKRTRPERKLMNWAQSQGVDPRSFPSVLMEGDESWACWMKRNELNPPIDVWEDCLRDQQEELLSSSMYPEASSVLSYLLSHGYGVAVASNLSASYAPFLNGFLDGMQSMHNSVIHRAWSFDVHAAKPRPEIFQYVANLFPHCQPSDFVMIGDKWREDVEGPRALGWSAVHLRRPEMDLWSALDQAHIPVVSPRRS